MSSRPEKDASLCRKRKPTSPCGRGMRTHGRGSGPRRLPLAALSAPLASALGRVPTRATAVRASSAFHEVGPAASAHSGGETE